VALLSACSPSSGDSPKPDGDAGGVQDAANDAAPTNDALGPSDAAPAPGANAVAVLDLGHGTGISSLHRTATRVVSGDWNQHWVLWDTATRAAITSGTLQCSYPPTNVPPSCAADYVSVAGGVFLVRGVNKNGPAANWKIEARSLDTGALLSTITGEANVGLSSDGGYVWIASTASFAIATPSGTQLFAIAGDYSHAHVYATSSTIRLVGGPMGAGQLEIIDVATHASTYAAVSGNFVAWFDDGTAFITSLGSTMWVYAANGTQLAIGAPNMIPVGGTGNFVWGSSSDSSGNRTMPIFRVSNLSTPHRTLTASPSGAFVVSGHSIANLSYGAGSLQISSIGTNTVTTGSTITTPETFLQTFAADDAGNWAIGNNDGVVADGADILAQSTTTYSLGRALSVAGTGGDTAAISTSSGHVLVMSVGAATSVTRTIAYLSSQIALSADGALLVAAGDLGSAQYTRDMSLRVYSTTNGTLVHSWPHSWSDYPTLLTGFSFATQGEQICQTFRQSDGTCSDVNGNPVQYAASQVAPLMSPDGAHALYFSQGATQIYSGSALVNAVPGVALAWIDNNHFLVATYTSASIQSGVQVYDASGAPTGTAMLPDVQRASLVSVGGTLAYWQGTNQVLDYTTGAVYWQGDPSAGNGTPVGDYVLYTKAEKAYLDRFR
jgi:hypothetical protein